MPNYFTKPDSVLHSKYAFGFKSLSLYIATGYILVQAVVSMLPLAVAEPFNPLFDDQLVASTNILDDVLEMAPKVEGTPVRLRVPSLEIDKVVDPGLYDVANKEWTITRDGVQYATPSVKANEDSGATLLYAHNRESAFGVLPQIKRGSKALVTTDNGYVFEYIYQTKQDYSPSDTSVFSYDGAPVLTLQTCGGTWNELRELYTFQLRSVRKLQ